jgi:dTDP-4-amino-4,6-dideoxygalactose transaminase
MTISPGFPIRPRERFLTFGAPNIGKEEIEEVISTLKSGWIGTGPRVAQFEEAFKLYKGSDNAAVYHAAAVNSCTAALHLSMLAAGLDPGDEVITTPLTFCATINAIIHAGAVPVLADVDPLTMNIDPVEIKKKITPRTRAILPVHFAGRPCEMEAILEIAQEHRLLVIEDCAHAIETEYHGKKAGTMGDFGCFSFYVTKNLTTGEGGMVLAKRREDIDRIKILALHGMSQDAWKRFSDEGYKHYRIVECGFKCNMMDLQASLGIHQLQRLENNWRKRQTIWEQYREALVDFPLQLPADLAPDTRHAYHLFTILVNEDCCGINRDQFLEAMTWHNIGVGIHYLSIPEHPYYQKRFCWYPEEYPNARRIGRQTVSLPLSPQLSEEDVQDVIGAIHQIIRR